MVALIIICFCAQDWHHALVNAVLNDPAQASFEGGGINLDIIGLIGPKGIPQQFVETLHVAFKKAWEDPDFIKMARQGDQTPFYRGPQELDKYLVSINEEIATLVKNLGIRKE